MKFLVFIIFIFLSIFCQTDADTWSEPEKFELFSENKKYMVEIIPVDYDKCKSLKDTTNYPACFPWAKIYYLESENNYKLLNTFKLVNEVSPTEALITNDGKYIITLDNWFHYGYGNDCIVVYSTNGVKKYNYSIKKFIPDSILPRLSYSMSSVDWREDCYLEEDKWPDMPNTLHIFVKYDCIFNDRDKFDSTYVFTLETCTYKKVIINLENGKFISGFINNSED